MKNFRDSLNEELKNPEFKKEWDALEEEYRQIRRELDSENTTSPKFFDSFKPLSPVANF